MPPEDPRPRDLHYEAFAFAFGTPATQSERQILNRAAKEARIADLHPREIVIRSRRALREFPLATPMIVVQRWSRFAAPAPAAEIAYPAQRQPEEDVNALARELGRPDAPPATQQEAVLAARRLKLELP